MLLVGREEKEKEIINGNLESSNSQRDFSVSVKNEDMVVGRADFIGRISNLWIGWEARVA